MDFIIALLMWFGLLAPGQTATDALIDQNQALIQQYQNDAEIQEFYNSQNSTDGGVTFIDLDEM